MRFFAGLLAYFVGVSALISIAVVGLMALQSRVDKTPAAPVALAASNNERLVGQAKAALATQKKTQPDRKGKAVHTAHKRLPAPPATVGSDVTYGFAQEPRRRIDPNLFFFFGR